MRIKERLTARNADVGGHRPVLIVCLGDSVTNGCFELRGVENPVRPWESYCAKLQRRLMEMYPVSAPTVLNAGVGGDNIGRMAARLDRDVLCFRPDLVILEAGLNDCLSGKTQADLEAFAEKVGAVIDRVLDAGAEMLLLTPNAMCSRLHESVTPQGEPKYALFCNAVQRQNNGAMDAYMEAARRQASIRQIPIADAYAEWHALQAQGVDTTELLANYINHPRPDMHDVFVRRIVEAMEG